MKLKRAWVYHVDERTNVTIVDGSNHPAEVMFVRWAKNVKRTRTFILTSR